MVQDVVVAGINRDEIGILCSCASTPAGLAGCRRRLGASARRRNVRDSCSAGRLAPCQRPAARRGSRALVLAEPPSIDRGEITDKGSINQRAVLTPRRRRALYLGRDRDVIVPRPREQRMPKTTIHR
jgi:feruloyl-CoA synthase